MSYTFKKPKAYQYTEEFAKLFEITLDDVLHSNPDSKKYFTALIELKDHKIPQEILANILDIKNYHPNIKNKTISEYTTGDLIYYANLSKNIPKTRWERHKCEHTYKYILARIEIFNKIKRKHPQNSKAYDILITKKAFNDNDKKYLRELLTR